MLHTYLVHTYFFRKDTKTQSDSELTYILSFFSNLGQIKAFGDKAERSHLRIEDRVVVHPSDPSPSTSYLRDTEFRVVSDVSYLVPISPHVPMKLAAMMAGRGLDIYDAVIQTKNHVRHMLDSQTNTNDR